MPVEKEGNRSFYVARVRTKDVPERITSVRYTVERTGRPRDMIIILL